MQIGGARVLSVAELPGRRDLLLVDIRPTLERRSELGFVPTSVSVPLAETRDAQLAQLAALDPAGELVLFCTSGRRSRAAWEALRELAGRPIHHLEGGQLAWGAAGLPLVAHIEAPERPRDLVELRRHLLACFAAQATEIALDHDETSIAPQEGLKACFDAADVAWESPTIAGFYEVLDRAALASHRAGADLRSIAENLAAMTAMLRLFERGG